MSECTWIDDICVCDNCGSFASSEEAIVHHETCQPGESKKWERFYSKMNQMKEAVIRYVEAKVEMTKCMQKHFRQLCNRCRKYDGCRTYGEYVDAWLVLQKYSTKEVIEDGSV